MNRWIAREHGERPPVTPTAVSAPVNWLSVASEVRYNLARTWLTCSQARTIALAFPDDTSGSSSSSSSSKHSSVSVGASRTNSVMDAAAAAAAASAVNSSTRSSLSGIAEFASTATSTTAAAGSKPQKEDSLNNNSTTAATNTSNTNNTAISKLREDVVVAAFSRVTDSSNFDAVLNTLSAAGQLSAARRLGWLNALNPDRIDRPFDLDLRNSDHRRLVEVLTELAITEPGMYYL
jgi:hypothetical protein